MNINEETYIARNGKTMNVVRTKTGIFASSAKDGVTVKVNEEMKTGANPFSGWDKKQEKRS